MLLRLEETLQEEMFNNDFLYKKEHKKRNLEFYEDKMIFLSFKSNCRSSANSF